MFAEVLKSVTIYDGNTIGRPDIGGWFPGAVRLPSGELLVMFLTGTDFEGDLTVASSRSRDDGETWEFAGASFENAAPALGCVKPVLLKNGIIAAVGYCFSPSCVLVNPETGGLAPGANYTAFSRDGGDKWSTPVNTFIREPNQLAT